MEEINLNLNSDSGNSSGTIKINLDGTNNVKKSVNFGPGAEMLMNPNKNKVSSPKADIGLSDLNELNDNFDTYRFNHDGKDHSKDWRHQEYIFFFDWLVENTSNLFEVFLALEDKRSKELFLHLLVFSLLQKTFYHTQYL